MLAPSVRVALIILHHFQRQRVSDCQSWWLTREVLLPSHTVCSQPFGDLQLFRGWIHKAEELFGAFALDQLPPGELGAVVCASKVLTYPQWVMTKGLTDLFGPCGGASCCLLDLFPCKLPQCMYSSRVETVTLFLPAPPCSCCVCASALLSVDFVWLGLSHVLSVCHWLLGHLNEISSWDLLCFLQSKSVYCLCEFSLLLNALCICLFFSNPLTWLLFFLLPSVL